MLENQELWVKGVSAIAGQQDRVDGVTIFQVIHGLTWKHITRRNKNDRIA